MIKRLIGFAGLAVVCMILTGCTAARNYSLRSYQGPLPMEDQRYVNPDSYGLPISPK